MRAAFYEVSWTTIFLPTLRDPWVCWIPTTALRGFPFHFVFQAQVLQTIHILLQSTRSESTLFCNLTAGWYLKLRLHWPTGWPSMLAASNWSETWHIWRLQVVFGSPWSPPRNQVVAADYDFRSLDLIKSINQPPQTSGCLYSLYIFSDKPSSLRSPSHSGRLYRTRPASKRENVCAVVL